MKDWHLTPAQWAKQSRLDRAYMMAQTRINRLLDMMIQHDEGERQKKEAEKERRKRGKGRR